MPYSVLVVDDSNFFQTRLKEIINESPDLNVTGIASNGQEAIDMAAKLKPDIISMDYEMPFLDGVSAVKIIMEENPIPIVMFSSMTYEGARITLDALEAGAVDFMNKNFAEVSANSVSFKKKFHQKLVTFAKNANTSAVQSAVELTREPAPAPEPAAPVARREVTRPRPAVSRSTPSAAPVAKSLKGKVKLLAIGSSTGGPVALTDIITQLPADFPCPVIIIQHMPENFTKAFAERLNRNSALTVKEAETGDRLEKGSVLVAPGGKQMMIERTGNTVKIIDGDDRVNYKPCVDITFASAASVFGGGVLGVVLTGMGSDGADGARLLKEKGSTIWSQNKETCVVYGMPAAVAKENITSCELPLKEIAPKIISEV
ncbi:MAG: chemotaxis response regulator protein-glutamate methylesterase [Agarilytica sp.]